MRKVEYTQSGTVTADQATAPFWGGDLGAQKPGAMVVISAPTVGWNIVKLISTQDDYLTWTVQYYNIKKAGTSGTNRLSNPYMSCWWDSQNVEIRSKTQPANTVAFQLAVKRKRILFEPFDLKPDGSLPNSVKASIRGRFDASKLVFGIE